MGKKNVLLLEDETNVAEIYKMWISELAEVDYVENGEDVIDKIEERNRESQDQYDLIISDRRITEGKNGDEMIKEVYKNPKISLENTEIAIVSAKKESKEMGDMEGLYDQYLEKPFSRDDVHDLLE